MDLLVSVIIPTYNRAKFVVQAVKSVLEQDYAPLEIIVVDDGSTDNTEEVLKPYFNCIIYSRQPNQGTAVARNAAIQVSRGEYIALLDSDDVWKEGKVRLQVEFLESHRQYGMVACNVVQIDSDGIEVSARGFRVTEPRVSLERVLLDSPLPPSSLLCRREALRFPEPFTPGLNFCEDWEFCLRLAGTWPIGFIDQPLVAFRSHAQNLTAPLTTQDQIEIHFSIRLRVLDSIYASILTEHQASWTKAKAHEFARFAVPTYVNRHYALAAERLRTAISLDPGAWFAGGELAGLIVFYAGLLLQKWGEREAFAFLDDLFAHLPAELRQPERMRRDVYARIQIAAAFADFRQARYGATLSHVAQGVRRSPRRLLNRGVISITTRSLIPPLRRVPRRTASA